MVCVLSAFLCLASSGAAYSGGTWKDLGTLPGGVESCAYGINDSGQIVGYSKTADGHTHAFLYSNGVMTDLGTLGGTDSIAWDINNSGQIVGYSNTVGGQDHAFSYINGKMTDLGTLSGWSYAYGIIDNGQTVGSLLTSYGTHAFSYINGVMTDLGTLSGWRHSCANGINDSGQIVGYLKNTSSQKHAFSYFNGVMTDLGTLGGTGSIAWDINNSGQIVGYSHIASGQEHAFSYINGKMTDLGHLGGGASYALGINDSGQIVGSSNLISAQEHAFLYSGGKMTDLGTLPGGNFSIAWGINNSGQIVGGSFTASPWQHAFLYTPEPTIVLSVSPTSLSPNCEPGQNAASQNFTVRNTGSGTLSYTISDNVTWLSVTPTSGTSTGEQDTITVNYATSGLAAGTYTGAITITAPGATGTPKTIGVTLTVTAAPTPPVLSVNPTSLSPICLKGRNAASQSFTVQNSGGGTLSYTVSDNATWLSVTPTSGTSTGEQDIITVSYATSGLSSGEHNATITISAPGATGTPKTIGVILFVKPPSIAPVLLLLLD
jgi:probable HAF family extracellular repeat protein